MSALWPFLRLMWRDQRAALLRGLALASMVLLAGIALLGLSGWFITAAGIAGLAGAGTMFDIFRPSAGVRFLALTRTASRYGERMLTHDATLRVLAGWRVRLLAGLAAAAWPVQARLRGGQALNRLTADVDALDGLAIRLLFPLLAGTGALLLGCAGLWWLTLPQAALWVLAAGLGGVALISALAGRAAAQQADLAETGRQALRANVVDHLRGRSVLAVEGRLPTARAAVLDHDRKARQAALRLAGIEIGIETALQALQAVMAAGGLLIGGLAVLDGRIGAAQAALIFFVCLAMAEVMAPLSRAIAEYGRMRGAARRLMPLIDAPSGPPPRAAPPAPDGGLVLQGLQVGRGDHPLFAPLTLRIAPGEMVALTGRSGAGKTTLLDTIAGLLPPMAGSVCLADGTPDESALRQTLGYLPQRPALTSGSLAQTLALAAPDADPARMQAVLEAVALPLPLERRLGEGGQGLSGGEMRRLALARTLIRRPAILLLDEPTEGLDADTARAVLSGLRAYLPGSAILIASHRPAERAAADRVVALGADARGG